MRLCLFEDRQVSFLEPLALTRPAFDLRCGAFALWQRHRAYFSPTELGTLVRPHLIELCQFTHPKMAVNDTDWLKAGPTVLVNARWLPPRAPPKEMSTPRIALVGDQLAYAVLPPDELAGCSALTLGDCLDRWKTTFAQGPAGGSMIDYPWDLVERNGEMLCQDFSESNPQREWKR